MSEPVEQSEEQPLIRSRRLARETALQAIYTALTVESEPSDLVQDALAVAHFAPETIAYIENLIEGTIKHRAEIEPKIEQYLTKGWDRNRIARIDLCVLLQAAYELDHIPDMPPKVTINEAVNLAKKFGSETSGKFVNGVLGKYLSDSDKVEWNPADYPEYVPESKFEDVAGLEPEVIEEGTAEHAELMKAGSWVIKKSID